MAIAAGKLMRPNTTRVRLYIGKGYCSAYQ